jgi:hypothetical protein
MQRGLVTAAIMLSLILAFYSLADAETRIVNIPCGQDIDATINADPRGTASRFVLGADCTFTAKRRRRGSMRGGTDVCATRPGV